MVVLKNRRVDIDRYVVEDATDLSFENTQEFQDNLLGQRRQIAIAEAVVLKRGQARQDELFNSWRLENGSGVPKYAMQTVSSWSSEDMVDFVQHAVLIASYHGVDATAKFQELFELKIQVEQGVEQLRMLKQVAQELNDSPNRLIEDPDVVSDLLAEIDDKDTVLLDRSYRDQEGLDRLKSASRLVRLHTDEIVGQNVKQQRLIKINLRNEALIYLQSVQAEKSLAAAKSKKTDTASSADLDF